MRLIRGIIIGAALATMLAAGVPEATAIECNASLSINRERTEPEGTFTRHVFHIDVNVQEQCAVVELNVALQVREPGQDTRTVNKYRKVRYRTRQLTTTHEYTADPGVDVLSWKVEQISCRECE